MKQHAHKICLNMIVKQEAESIRKCLDSVTPYISSWCIVDTGSTDGTQEIIQDYFAKLGIPGVLHERPWQDFGTNRTEAIHLALQLPIEKEYLLVIDADDILTVTNKKAFENLDKDAYLFEIHMNGMSWWRTQLFRATSEWRYKGVLHEALSGPTTHTSARCEGVAMWARTSSAKRDGYKDPKDKFLKDAQVFETAIADMTPEEDPDLYARYHFYCAQSYRDAQDYESAIDWYTKRAELEGWVEEIWYSLYMCARIKESIGRDQDEVIGAYIRAWQFRPSRLEAPFFLVKYLNEKKMFFVAWSICQTAVQMTKTTDILFIERDIWEWRLPNEWNICCFQVGKFEQAKRAAKELINSPVFPKLLPEWQEGIRKNYRIYRKVLEDLERVRK